MNFSPNTDARLTLADLFEAGTNAVMGTVAVSKAIEAGHVQRPTRILATGKAATSMYFGLPESWRKSCPALLVTKKGHASELRSTDDVRLIEAGHPVPNQASLEAGKEAIKFVSGSTENDHLLFLVSGGSSALVEELKEDLRLKDLTAMTEKMLSEGWSIENINRARCKVSLVKNGKLLGNFGGKSVDVLAISDVENDKLEVIGSGIAQNSFEPVERFNARIVASNAMARDEIARAAEGRGLKVIENAETLYADISDLARDLSLKVRSGPAGLYIFGGEPTVKLPANPGRGGRNQALALELATFLVSEPNIFALVAGTDGTDGNTEAAGGFADSQTTTAAPGIEGYIQRADSAQFLEQAGSQFVTGPTGTNVMDVVLIYKKADDTKDG